MGASHDSPRAQTCTVQGPGASNTTKIPRPQEREERKKTVAGKMTGSPSCAFSRILPVRTFSMSARRNILTTSDAKSRPICSFGMMPTCNRVRKYTTLQCRLGVLTNSIVRVLFSGGFSQSSTKFGRNLTPGDNRYVMSSSSFNCNPSPWDEPKGLGERNSSSGMWLAIERQKKMHLKGPCPLWWGTGRCLCNC